MLKRALKQTATAIGIAQARLAEAKHWLESARYTLDRAQHEEKLALNNYVVCRDQAREITGNEELE